MSHVSASAWPRSVSAVGSRAQWSAQSPTTLPPMNGFATYVPSVGYIPDEDDQDDFVMVDDKISMAPVENASPTGRRKRRIIRRPGGEYGSFLKGLKSMFQNKKHPDPYPTLPPGFVPDWAVSTAAPTPATWTVTMPVIQSPSPPQSPSSTHSSIHSSAHSHHSSVHSESSSKKSSTLSPPPNIMPMAQLQQQYYGSWPHPLTLMMATAPPQYVISPIIQGSQAGFSAFPGVPFSPQRSPLPNSWFARAEPATQPPPQLPQPQVPDTPSTEVESISSAPGSPSPPASVTRRNWPMDSTQHPSSQPSQLNPLLVHGNSPAVHFDVRRVPSLITSGAASEPVIPLSDAEQAEPATWPVLTMMTISHLADDGAFPSPAFPSFPWPVHVRNPAGVTCGDLWHAIYSGFRVHLTRAEYERLPRARREQVDVAYWQRCRTNLSWEEPPPGPEDGCRRIDFMGTRIIFRGLEPSSTGNGTWTMFMGPP